MKILDFVEGGATSVLISVLDPGRDPVVAGIDLSSASLLLSPSLLTLVGGDCGCGGVSVLIGPLFDVPGTAATSELRSIRVSLANRFSVGTGAGDGYVEGVPSSLTTTSPYRFL